MLLPLHERKECDGIGANWKSLTSYFFRRRSLRGSVTLMVKATVARRTCLSKRRLPGGKQESASLKRNWADELMEEFKFLWTTTARMHDSPAGSVGWRKLAMWCHIGDGLNAGHRIAELNTSVRISRVSERVVRGFAVNYPSPLTRSNAKALPATPHHAAGQFAAVSGVRRRSRCSAVLLRSARSDGRSGVECVDDEWPPASASMGRVSWADRDCTNWSEAAFISNVIVIHSDLTYVHCSAAS